VGLVSITFVIEYPESIPSRIVVTTANPPVSVMAFQNGELEILSVTDNEKVAKDQLLAVIKNSARHSDILQVCRHLELNTIKGLLLSDVVLILGEIQGDFNKLVYTYREMENFRSRQFYQKKIKDLRSRITLLENLQTQTKQQLRISEREMGVESARYRRDSLLFFVSKAITEDDYSMATSKFLLQMNSIENHKNAVISNQISVNEINNQIVNLQLEYEQRIDAMDLEYQTATNQLISSLEIWKRRYELRAPIAGHVSFYEFWSEQQFVQAGSEVFTIVPGEKLLVKAKMMMPIEKSGQVKKGQHVNIKLEGFPYKEFGVLKGSVENVSLVPKNQVYAVDVSLDNGLTTTYGTQIELKQQMEGNAEVITKDTKLYQRILYQFKDILINQTD
jgi:HlyD family secretion protein